MQTKSGDGSSTRTGDRTTYLNRFAYATIGMLTGAVTRRGGTKNPKDQGRARTEPGASAAFCCTQPAWKLPTVATGARRAGLRCGRPDGRGATAEGESGGAVVNNNR